MASKNNSNKVEKDKNVNIGNARHAYEYLQFIEAAENEEEKVELLKKWGATLPLSMLLSLNFDTRIALDLPEGAPPLNRDEKSHADMFAPLAAQIDRLKHCLKSNSIARLAKERVFIQVLEMISPKEVDVLIACKDKKLTELYPSVTADLVKRVFPNYVS